MTQVAEGTYPIAEDVMNLARALINDMIRATGGQILTDTAPYTIFFLNSAIRKTQRYLANNGLLSNVVDNAILTPITPVANQDPATQVFISALGYYNGTNTLSSVVLPPDLILPLSIAQRQTGSGAQFTPMMPAKGPLMSRIPGPYFGEWEWRNDAINMVVSKNVMDIRVPNKAPLRGLSPTKNFSLPKTNIRDGEDA